MRVYILGPMRGIPHYNFPAFDAMRDRLEMNLFDVVSPADLDRQAGCPDPLTMPANTDWSVYPEGTDLVEVVERDVSAILTCDAYVALAGWENSTGAKAEKGVLDWKGAQRIVWNSETKLFNDWREPVKIHPDWKTAPYPASLDNMNPKDKLGMKKPPLHLIPASALVYLSRVMALGAKKYGPGNWRQHPVKMTVYLSAAWRHILQALDGEDKDAESGIPPMAHAMACCAIILDAQACGCLIDDRPPKGAAPKLMVELTEKNEPNFASVKAAVAEMKEALDIPF